MRFTKVESEEVSSEELIRSEEIGKHVRGLKHISRRSFVIDESNLSSDEDTSKNTVMTLITKKLLP